MAFFIYKLKWLVIIKSKIRYAIFKADYTHKERFKKAKDSLKLNKHEKATSDILLINKEPYKADGSF